MAKQINLGRFRGEDAKINGVNTLTIQGGDGIHVHQAGSELTISADGFGSHIHDFNNPHRVTKSQVGLGNVDNKSESTIIADMKESLVPSDITEALGYTPADTTKAMTPQQVNAAIASAITVKQDVLTGVQGQLVGFDNEGKAIAVPGITLVVDDRMIPGSANPVQSQVIQAALADATGDISELEGDVSALETRVGTVETNLSAHTGNKNNPHSVTKAQVGLGNVDNKSEATIISDAKTQIMTSTNINAALGYTAANASDLTALTTRVGTAETTIGQHTTSISNLNAHTTNKNNPHEVKASQLSDLTDSFIKGKLKYHTLTISFSGPTGDTSFPTIPNYVAQLMEGESYTVTLPELENYVPPEYFVTGTMGSSDVTLSKKYSKRQGKLTIKYVVPDAAGVTIPDYSANIDVGSSYSVPSPTSTDYPRLAGYTPTKATVSGTMVKGGVTITVQYEATLCEITFHHTDSIPLPPGTSDVPTPSDFTIKVMAGQSYCYTPPPVVLGSRWFVLVGRGSTNFVGSCISGIATKSETIVVNYNSLVDVHN